MSITAASALDVASIRRQFPVLDQDVSGRPLVYLDNGATAQRPAAVLDALRRFYEMDNANVHRGIHELSRRATDGYEGARVRVAEFLNAPDPKSVVFTRGTTESINLVANAWGGANIRAGDEIVLTVMEHHSNLIPWQMLAQRTGAQLRFIDIDEQGRLRLDMLDDVLTARTRLVAFNHVSNSLGTINPVAELTRRAHDAGALVLIDGAQAAPHVHVDVQAIGCDFYAFSGHKMGAPMGIGALWGRREIMDELPPWMGGGEMVDLVELSHATYAPVPHRLEAGTPNVGGAVALAAAIDWLEGVGRDAIEGHENTLLRHGMERLRGVEGLRLFGPASPDERIAIFPFAMDGAHPHDVATILDAHGIAIRAGHHCTQPLMRRLGVPATTRASCWLYNTTDELDRLAEGLEEVRRIFA